MESMDQTPDLNAMVLFARVLQHGSFSEAARRTGTPVSTLSRKVSALERRLGVRLLERTTRAINPTESGREYFLYCEQIVEALDGAQAALEKRQVEVTGTLRVAAPPSLSDVLLVPLVEGFLRRYSNVAVKVLVTDQHLDLVQDEVDVSLRVGPQPASSLVFRRLLRYRHILVAAPAYIADAAALAEPADLSRHRLLGFTKWFDETTWTLSNGSRTVRVPAKLWLGINDYAGVIRAAVAGMGVAEVPSVVCQRELLAGHLIPVLMGWRFEEVDLSAYSLSRRHPSRVVELFLEHCVAHAEEVSRSVAPAVEPPPRHRKRRAAPTR
jgi:DNA-binding transcriptional LysR family regulator